MKKKLTFAAVTVMSTAFLAACSAAPSSSSANAEGTKVGDTLKVGLNFESTGDVSAYGNAGKNGAQLAIAEINKGGGVDGKKIKAFVKDNKSDNSESATVTTNLTTESSVNAVVGPMVSSAVASASPNAEKAAVPLIAPAATQDDLTVGKDGKTRQYMFRTTFIDSYQGEVLSKFLSNDLKAKKVVLYYDNSSDYSKGIAKEFKKHYKGDIVSESTFQAKDTDFQSALTKFKDEDFDAIVMPGYYQEVGTIIKQAREMGIEASIVGPDGFADDKLVELAGAKNASNVYYVSGYSAKTSQKAAAFAKAYKEKYGEEPSMFAALGYDSVYMVADAAKGANNSAEIAKNLAKTKDFEGATGTMTIDKKHNPVKSVSVVGLTDGKESSATVVEADK
ncbi:ABC transporter substrate-binding protein [Streptococcus halotolerans]|uniref:ABC transporter substrate-binding protein n=1 Tax=Streptococcus halotolerans TaxID=1814128 RepID=UPI000789009C|nr:ABC transporter substrate-binding protein [Streptococcus halotolerans]